MHLFVWTDGFNYIEAGHIRETDVGNREAKLASERLFDSVVSRENGRHVITLVLENYLEGIGDAPLVLDDEDCTFLGMTSIRHDLGTAIVRPQKGTKSTKGENSLLCFLCLFVAKKSCAYL